MADQYLVANVRKVFERLNAEAFKWYHRRPEGRSDWRREFVQNPRNYWPKVKLQFFSSKQAVASSIPSKDNLTNEFQHVMFLEPMLGESTILPALHCTWDFADAADTLRIKLGLFIETDDKRIMLCGMRFETPEGIGDHNYYHAQPIISFRKSQPVGDFTASWWPTKFPAVLLKAKDPLMLLATMCISLYGGGYLPKVAAVGLVGGDAQTSIKNLLAEP